MNATRIRALSKWVQPIVGVTIIASFGAFGLASLWPMLHDAWSNKYGAFSHGYLVLVMCLWMGNAYWRDKPPSRLAPDMSGFLVLGISVITLVSMEALSLHSSRLVLLPVLLLSVIAATFGRDCALRLAWPVTFLYMALPQWWVVNTPLQALTSAAVGTFLQLTGVTAYMEGNTIHVPAGVFEVASGCSGLSYLVAALSLAGFYALMYLREWRHRLILLCAAAALAILANWARVYALVVIGVVTDMQHYLIRVEHLHFGWAVFAAFLVPVPFLGARLTSREVSGPAEPVPQAPVMPAISGQLLLAALAAGLILLIPRLLAVSLPISK